MEKVAVIYVAGWEDLLSGRQLGLCATRARGARCGSHTAYRVYGKGKYLGEFVVLCSAAACR